jgi:hypothetical protein
MKEQRLIAIARFYRADKQRASAMLGAVLMLLLLPHILVAKSGFVHTQGRQLVDGQCHVLMLRGTNLGNWLVLEGNMFHFDDGPLSTREIEALANKLLDPTAARKFWHDPVVTVTSDFQGQVCPSTGAAPPPDFLGLHRRYARALDTSDREDCGPCN